MQNEILAENYGIESLVLVSAPQKMCSMQTTLLTTTIILNVFLVVFIVYVGSFFACIASKFSFFIDLLQAGCSIKSLKYFKIWV